jgi:ketosteroid isomerase-like protein
MTVGRLTLALLLCASVWPANARPAQQPDPAPVAAAEEAEHESLRQMKTAYERAIRENNIDALAPYFSDQFHGVMLTGRVVTNIDELKRFWADMRALIGEGGSYTTTLNPERSVIAGDVALARGSSDDVVVTSEKQEFRFTSYWTAVLRKQEGQWKVVQVQGTIDPVENPFVREFRRRSNQIVIPLSALGGVAAGLFAAWLLRRRRAGQPSSR